MRQVNRHLHRVPDSPAAVSHRLRGNHRGALIVESLCDASNIKRRQAPQKSRDASARSLSAPPHPRRYPNPCPKHAWPGPALVFDPWSWIEKSRYSHVGRFGPRGCLPFSRLRTCIHPSIRPSIIRRRFGRPRQCGHSLAAGRTTSCLKVLYYERMSGRVARL